MGALQVGVISPQWNLFIKPTLYGPCYENFVYLLGDAFFLPTKLASCSRLELLTYQTWLTFKCTTHHSMNFEATEAATFLSRMLEVTKNLWKDRGKPSQNGHVKNCQIVLIWYGKIINKWPWTNPKKLLINSTHSCIKVVICVPWHQTWWSSTGFL